MRIVSIVFTGMAVLGLFATPYQVQKFNLNDYAPWFSLGYTAIFALLAIAWKPETPK